jgi:hypothetical protein
LMPSGLAQARYRLRIVKRVAFWFLALAVATI